MKILCLGDSFTKGFGVKENENWISQLDLPDIDFINGGINGDTTSGMLARLRHDVIDQSPRYVLITGGVNDFISGSSTQIPQNNYMAMVHQAFESNIIPIVGIAPGFSPDHVRSDWAAFCDFTEAAEKQNRFRLWLHQFCHTFGVFFIDFFQEFEKVKESQPAVDFYLDGIHLTREGHRHISHIAEKAFNHF